MACKQEESSIIDNNVYNSAILHAHFSQRSYLELPIMQNNYNNENISNIQLYKSTGIPFIIKNNVSLFQCKWLLNSKHNNKSNNKSKTLDIETMINDIGDDYVPVVKPNYDELNPIKSQIKVKTFLERAWLLDSNIYYLHQWQFPLSNSSKTIEIMCNNSNSVPCLGLDLLQYGLDSCIFNNKRISPYQYLFMGATNTYTKLHRDTGGLTILIAPVIGDKEVILCHRDDGRLINYGETAIIPSDYSTNPTLSFARVWKITISPGDILVIPAGTYHSARNITACMSYSRFHLDQIDLYQFYNSWIVRDALTIPHKEIIWNCCIELIVIVEKLSEGLDKRTIHSNTSIDKSIEIRDSFKYLSSLRHLVKCVTDFVKEADKSKGVPSIDIQLDEWVDLLIDIDIALKEYLVAELSQIQAYEPTTKRINKLTRKSTVKTISSSEETINNQISLNCSYSLRNNKRSSYVEFDVENSDEISSIDDDSYSHDDVESKYNKKCKISEVDSKIPNQHIHLSRNITNKLGNKLDSEIVSNVIRNRANDNKNDNGENIDHIQNIDIYNYIVDKKVVNDIIDNEINHLIISSNKVDKNTDSVTSSAMSSDTDKFLYDTRGNIIKAGVRVSIHPYRFYVNALDVYDKLVAIRVHYEGFEELYDEYISINDLKLLNGSPIKSIDQITFDMKVLSLWGESKDEYIATVLTLPPRDKHYNSIVSDVIYDGPMVKVAFNTGLGKGNYIRIYPLYLVKRKVNKR